MVLRQGDYAHPIRRPMAAIRSRISDPILIRRHTDHPVHLRLIYQAANDTKSLFICGVFSALLNVSGILAGIFIFKSLEAVAWCICATFAINFIQCYVWMYKVTLKRSLASLIRQLISPAPLVGILIVCLWSIHQSSIILPELANLFIKAVIAVLISCIYIQLSGVYNIINFLKSKIKR